MLPCLVDSGDPTDAKAIEELRGKRSPLVRGFARPAAERP
jgi:hypothetical protein